MSVPEERKSEPSAGGPLADLRVVELGGEIAVRYCGRLMAALGARVARVDAPPVAAAFGAWLDQGKGFAETLESAIIDVGEGEQPILVIAGQTRGDIRAAEARLAALDVPTTLLALTWFDDYGPYADWRGNDAIAQAMTGVAYAFGPREGPPVLPQGHAPQIVGGLVGFIAALGGLINRGAEPRRIDVNVLEAALCFAETGAVAAAASGFTSQRLGVNRFAPTYPCSFYQTTDGWVGVTTLTPGQWAALVGEIGRPELATDERYSTTYRRLPRADEIDALLTPIIARRSTADWVALGDRLRIPITPALRPSELPRAEHWRVRGSFRPVDDTPGAPEGPTLPFRFQFDGAGARRPVGGAHGPLTGVRVADFSMGWAGPLATRYLADLGADVLKIESHGRPDWWRGWEVVEALDPPPTEVQRNFMAVNRGKRGLDLDLAGPRGKAAAAHIVAVSDVVIDNQGPGVMDRLGLGPADQRRLRPSVISISMPPFGRTGPLSGLRAYGSTVEQASGMPFVNGHDAWPPCHQHVAYGDAVAGLYGAAAALIGLWARERLGGVEIDLCQVECLFQLGAAAIIAEQARGAPLPREGSRRPELAPCCVVRAAGEAEAWLAVALDDDAAWPALSRTIGRDDLGADPALAGLAGRKAREDELEAAVAAWARTLAPAAAGGALQRAGVTAAPVLATSQLCADLHLAASEFWVLQHRRYVGDHLTPHAPFRFDGARPLIRRPAPVLGEHTDEVLLELGFGAATPEII